MTTYELAKRYMQMHCAKLAELIEYDWSDAFKEKELSKFIDDLQAMEGYRYIDPNNLTKDQLLDLGGRLWSDDNGDYILIPLWLKAHLPTVFNGSCLGAPEKLLKTSEIDNDHRFGCLAYGVYLCQK